MRHQLLTGALRLRWTGEGHTRTRKWVCQSHDGDLHPSFWSKSYTIALYILWHQNYWDTSGH